MAENLISPQEYDYEEPRYQDDRAPGIIAGSVVLVVAASIAVVLRLVARKVSSRASSGGSAGHPWGPDDFVIVLALVLAYGMFIVQILAAHFGLGKQVIRVGYPHGIEVGHLLYAQEALYSSCTTFTKVSILLMYRRIFLAHSVNRRFQFAWYVVLALLLGWGISDFFVGIFQCKPVASFWHLLDGKCININDALVSLAAINVAVNIAILILPLPMVWKLKLNIRSKMTVSTIFIIGCGDVLASIIRLALTSQIPLHNINFTSYDTNPVMLEFIEPTLGIICACLPATRLLFSRMLGSSSSKRSKPSGTIIVTSKESASGTFVPPTPQAPVFPRALKPESGWIELGPQEEGRKLRK